MKTNFLLSVFALCCATFMSIDAMAQWAEPTPPELPQEVNATVIESGKTYFIKNVGAGQFITGGNSWSAKISLTQAGINSDIFEGLSPALPILVSDFTETSGNLNGVTGVTLQLNGTHTIYGDSGGRTFTNTKLFRDRVESGYIDHGQEGWGYIWKISKADNGYFRIQTADGDPSFPNAATQYAGWDNSQGAIESDPETGELISSASTAVLFNMTGEYENECIEWMFIPADSYVAQKKAYETRVKLYEKYLETIDIAETEGLDVDMSGAETIYNNPNATIEELNSAIADLSYQVNVAIFQRDFGDAIPEDPIDATDIVLVNASLDGNISGWDNTFRSGVTAVNCAYQGASYTNDGTTLTELGSALNEDDQPAFLNGFIEAWRPNDQDPHHIGDAQLSQTIYGLPTGVYKLTCDANAVQQGSYFPNPVTGVKLFIATDTGKEVSVNVATKNGNPEHFSVTFTCPEGVKAMTFGLKTENTTANWIAADNFRIYYYGNSDIIPEMLILKDQLRACEETSYSIEDNANAGILNAYVDALDAANAIVALGSAATAEQCETATSVLKAAFDAVRQSINDYIKLQSYIDEASGLIDKCTDAGFAEAADAINNLIEEWEYAFDERTATKEMIDALAGLAHKTMIDKIGEADIPVGTDLTFLLKNPDFTYGTTQNPTGWTINSGSMGELRTSTHNIETWHKTFDISQTIANMPAGVYDITLQGFVRHDGAKTDGTWLYGGISKAYLIDLDNDVDQKSTKRIYTDAKPAMGDTNYDNSRGISTDLEGNTLYQCNGMTGAYYWFQETNPNTGEPYYTNHVKVILDKKGDLTIGIHTEATEDWVIFDNFKITYLGMTTAPMIATLENKLEEFTNLLADDDTRITKKAEELSTQIPAQAQLAIDSDDANSIIAMIQTVDEAIEYVKAGNEACKAFSSLVFEYDMYAMNAILETDLEPTDEDFPALLDQYAGSYAYSYNNNTDFTDFADNYAVNAAIQSLRDGWVPYIMSAANEATQADPVDVTLAIANANYMNFAGKTSVAGWNEVDNKFATGNIEAGVAEFFITNYNLSQTISGLTPGYYQVSVDGFYRAGWPSAAAETQVAGTLAHNAFMYAESSEEKRSKTLKDIFAGAQEIAYGVGGENAVSILEDDNMVTRYIPNLRSAAAVYLESGAYTNTIKIKVGDDGKLTIGLKKGTLIDGDWTTFNNWHLLYLGPDNNSLNVSDLSIVVSESNTVEIGLQNNYSNLVAFQMDMTLPDGVTIDKDACSLSSRIIDQEQELIIGKLESGAYRLTSSSLSLTPISGQSGTLLSLKLIASDDCEGGEATINNIRFSTSDSEKIIMSDETFNIEVLKKFNVTYMLDGEVYKSEETVYKTPLTLEAEPTKDGYTFGGWSELPETMPNHDIEVTGRFYLYGDVNTDEEVDVVDVVDIARYVVATPSAYFRENLADLNGDETVNLGDAITLVNHIAGDQNFVKAEFAASHNVIGNDALSLTKSGESISMNLNNNSAYTAFQFDLYVSEDSNVNQMQLSVKRLLDHQLLYNKIKNGHYRIAVLSTSNSTFSGNEGELMSFALNNKPGTEVSVQNIHFFDARGNDYLFDAISYDVETGVGSIHARIDKPIYDLQGRKLSKMQRGINIVGGKKVVVK